jgi:putative methionine-R-sulfoxide reductase with GAF domain
MSKKIEIIRRENGIFRHNLATGESLLNAYIELSPDGTIRVNANNYSEVMQPNEIYIKDELNDSSSVNYETSSLLSARLKRLNYNDWDTSNSGSTIDRELVVTTYSAKTAFTGSSIGDTITATQVIDVTGAPTTVSTVWRNQTTGLDLASAPSAANLTLLGSQALTDAQLRATDIPVSTPLPELPITGQGKIATTGTAIQMPSKALKNGIVIKASPDNLSPLFIGASDVTTVNDGTGNGYKLDPGEAISYAIKNTNTIYVNGTAASIFYYSGN